jgi:acetate kinase
MKILVLNCGSSSLKYQLIEMTTEEVLAKGLVERIVDHSVAIKSVLDTLLSETGGVIKSIDELSAVGHRVVHGGEKFAASVIINDEIKKSIEECCELAPLHNPPNLTGIEACEKIMPGIPQVAVFDTAFHQTLPEKAYLYAIPYELYEKYKIRKYGFHGTSHRFVSEEAAKLLGKPLSSLKIITCHLGNGASVCAVDGGKSVDTSMGFTPLEGLIMGTRSGDIDPAAVEFIMNKENITVKETLSIFNKQSGVLGVSGVSSDFRDIEAAAASGNRRATAALDMFYYRVAKYIGDYAAAMNGVDAVVFTAGLGENSTAARANICAYLGFLGLAVDGEKNSIRGKATDFATEDSKVRALLIPTKIIYAR